MPRKKSDQVITHRVEMGAWERDHIGKPLGQVAETTAKFDETMRVVKTGAMAAVGVASLGAIYVAYKIGASLYEWIDDSGVYGDWKTMRRTLVKPFVDLPAWTPDWVEDWAN